jgi:predicted acylesterase/phospholipase RssA/CRP-like cAMP-binding protein
VDRIAAYLRNVQVFAGLPEDLLERLASQVDEVSFHAGEWILRTGESADSLFVIRSGQVDVIDEGPPETTIRALRRGDVLGELGLLGQGTRSASARARRDVELIRLSQVAFEALVAESHSFAIGLTRSMGIQLAASRTPITASTPPTTVAVIGLNAGAPTVDVSAALTEALSQFGTVARFTSGDLSAIDKAVTQVDRVVLCGGLDPDDEWSRLCIRESDLVLVVATAGPDDAWLQRSTELRGCEMLVLARSVSQDTIDRFQPRQVQVVPDPTHRQRALEALARRLAGRSLGVVLSGGGARAFAHVGVLEVLAQSGLRIDRIAGVSLGSIIAGGTAQGLSPDELRQAIEETFARSNPTNDYVPPVHSLLRGAKTRRVLGQLFGERVIEELPLRFFCVSCDLVTRQAVVHTTGPVADSVYASLAIPGIFPPVVTNDGRLLVDGGVLNNLPVASMSLTGEGPVIAVDVTGRTGQARRPQRSRLRQFGHPIRRLLTGSEDETPLLGETIVRAMTVGSSDTVFAARKHADLVISPQVDGIGLMEWKALSSATEVGRRAAHLALSSNPEWLASVRS